MDKIIGLGNALVDVLATLKEDETLKEMQLPKGSMQLIDEEKRAQIDRLFANMETHRATGGSAGNTILALANLGMKPGFIGKVGADEYGDFFRDNCEQKGIEARLMKSELPSGVASTFISPDGERTFGTFLGAAATMKADDLQAEMLKGYQYLYVEGYLVQDHALIERAMELGKQAGMTICLDLASYNIVENDLAFITSLVERYVDIVFANEEEAHAFAQATPEVALQQLAAKTRIAIVKIGAKGAYLKRGEEQCLVPAYEVTKVMDTTGAGDFFAAGVLYGLTSGATLEQCGKIGSLLSAAVIQQIGTTLPEAKWNEIKLNIQQILSE
jgi:sugar/nucleoside kinase (ribokinase family)